MAEYKFVLMNIGHNRWHRGSTARTTHRLSVVIIQELYITQVIYRDACTCHSDMSVYFSDSLLLCGFFKFHIFKFYIFHNIGIRLDSVTMMTYIHSWESCALSRSLLMGQGRISFFLIMVCFRLANLSQLFSQESNVNINLGFTIPSTNVCSHATLKHRRWGGK